MTRLRIMTANLWGNKVDPAGLAGTLLDLEPDVLAVQELEIAAAEVIAAHFDHCELEPIGESMGGGMATRHAAKIEKIPLRYRSAWRATLDDATWPELSSAIEVVGVHLANAIAWPWWRSVAHRRLQLAGLLAHCDRMPLRRIIVGDFNSSPAWPAYKQMAARFGDAALAVGDARPTWRFRGMTPPLLRIDHAFGEEVEFLACRRVEVPGADHLALVTDVAA